MPRLAGTVLLDFLGATPCFVGGHHMLAEWWKESEI